MKRIYSPIAAVTLGAKIIEKHITLDKDWEGNDHKVSLLLRIFGNGFSNSKCRGSNGRWFTRTPTQGEIMNRASLAKSIIAGRKILKGIQKICSQDIIIKN